MKYIISLIAAATLAIVTFGPTREVSAESIVNDNSAIPAGGDCVRTEFKTEAIKAACEKGGQSEAKKAMKEFLKTAKKKDPKMNCKTCHSKLKPNFELKKDGLELYKKHGGK